TSTTTDRREDRAQPMPRRRQADEREACCFPRILVVTPHGPLAMLNRFWSMLPSSNAYRVFDSDHEDLAVADLAVAGAAGHRELVHHGGDDLRLHHRLDLEPRPERDVHGRATVFFGVSALGAATLDLGHRHSRDA